jgi:RNA polymerase sigma factor (sigma-70 family)
MERSSHDPSPEQMVVLECFLWVRGLVHHLCRAAGIAPSSEPGLDCEQHVKIALWKARGKLLSLRDEGERRAYALAAARHEVRHFLKHLYGVVMHEVPLEAAEKSRGTGVEPPGAGSLEELLPSRSLEEDLSRPELLDTYHALREKQRQLLSLLFHEGLTMAEAAERLGESVETVRKRRQRALAAFRKRLGPPG